jgi:hypothetical protein
MFFGDGSVSEHLRQNIQALTPVGLRHIYASLAAALATMLEGAEDAAKLNRVLQLGEILYDQAATFSKRWMEFAASNRGHDSFAERLAYRLNDEICPVLKLPSNAVVAALSWMPILTEIQAFSDELLQNVGWREACRSDLKDVARSF